MRTIPGKPTLLCSHSQQMQRDYAQMSKAPNLPSTGRYNLTICHEKKFVWFRVAKVGTRTILNHLGKSNITLDVEHGSSLYYPVNEYDDYFKFAFVRNPWDRFVSCWLDKIVNRNRNLFGFNPLELERMEEFENFIDYASTLDIESCDRHLRLQMSLIDLNHIDYIGRMESFDVDIAHIFEKLGLENNDIVPKNVTSRRKPYREYYNEETARRVGRIYRKDIQLFGYQF